MGSRGSSPYFPGGEKLPTFLFFFCSFFAQLHFCAIVTRSRIPCPSHTWTIGFKEKKKMNSRKGRGRVFCPQENGTGKCSCGQGTSHEVITSPPTKSSASVGFWWWWWWWFYFFSIIWLQAKFLWLLNMPQNPEEEATSSAPASWPSLREGSMGKYPYLFTAFLYHL